MIFATVVKLALWVYCESLGNKIVRAYAKDHYFDVVTNVVGLIAAVLGDKYYWWIDLSGAILLALYTITNWSGTVLENAISHRLLENHCLFNAGPRSFVGCPLLSTFQATMPTFCPPLLAIFRTDERVVR